MMPTTPRPELARLDALSEQLRRTYGEHHPHTVASRLGLGLATADAGDLEGAIRVLSEALRSTERAGRPGDGMAGLLRAELAGLSAELAERRSGGGLAGPGRVPGARFRRKPGARTADPVRIPDPVPDAQPEPAPPARRAPRGARFPRATGG